MDTSQSQVDFVAAGIAAAHRTILELMVQASPIAVTHVIQIPDGQRLHSGAWLFVRERIVSYLQAGNADWTTAAHYEDAATKKVRELLEDYRWTG